MVWRLVASTPACQQGPPMDRLARILLSVFFFPIGLIMVLAGVRTRIVAWTFAGGTIGLLALIVVLGIIGTAVESGPDPVSTYKVEASNSSATPKPTRLSTSATSVPTKRPLFAQSPVTSQPFLVLDSVIHDVSEYAPIDGDHAGYIEGFSGHACEFSQVGTIASSQSYFFPSLTGSETIMIFADDRCMTNTDSYSNVDEMKTVAIAQAQYRINEQIATWYSKPDADFMTQPDDLQGLAPSLLRKKGWCIESRKYPTWSFIVDYFWMNNGIGAVMHSPGQGSCKESYN